MSSIARKQHISAGDKRRAELLDAMEQVLLTTPVADLSVRTLASKVGITAPTMIHHFGTKEEILYTLFDHIVEKDLTRIGKETAAGSLEQVTRRIVDQYTDPTEEPRLRTIFEIMGLWLKQPEVYGEFLHRFNDRRNQVIKALILADGINEDDAENLAALIGDQSRGALISYLATGDQARLRNSVELILKWYRRYLEMGDTRPSL